MLLVSSHLGLLCHRVVRVSCGAAPQAGAAVHVSESSHQQRMKAGHSCDTRTTRARLQHRPPSGRLKGSKCRYLRARHSQERPARMSADRARLASNHEERRAHCGQEGCRGQNIVYWSTPSSLILNELHYTGGALAPGPLLTYWCTYHFFRGRNFTWWDPHPRRRRWQLFRSQR